MSLIQTIVDGISIITGKEDTISFSDLENCPGDSPRAQYTRVVAQNILVAALGILDSTRWEGVKNLEGLEPTDLSYPTRKALARRKLNEDHEFFSSVAYALLGSSNSPPRRSDAIMEALRKD